MTLLVLGDGGGVGPGEGPASSLSLFAPTSSDSYPHQMRSRGLNSSAKGYLKGIQEAQAETGSYTGRWVRARPITGPCLLLQPSTSPPAMGSLDSGCTGPATSPHSLL